MNRFQRVPGAVAVAALLASCASAPERRPGPPDRPAAQVDQTSGSTAKGASPPGQGAQPAGAAEGDSALKQANNPLANMKALNFHNYYVPELAGVDDTANTFWVRYAQPVSTGVGDWLVRASLPVSTVPTGMQENESGLGDGNVFAAYLFDTGDPSLSYGVGPLLGVPTATDDVLGRDQWSAGAAAVLFDARSAHFQYGGLLTYQHKIGGSDRAPDTNLLAAQPFGILQMGNGVYFRSSGIWAFDLESGDYSVPVGAGLGRVVKIGKVVLNFFAEPQFTVLQDGNGQPEFQLFFGFNTQFLGG